MKRRILETSENKVKEIVNRFFEKHFQKTVVFEQTSVKYVWRVKNANTPKGYNIFSEMVKLIESTKLNDDEKRKFDLQYTKDNPTVFMGRGYVSVGCTANEASRGLERLNPNTDRRDMFDINEFEGIWIAYD
jgi:hypothetical protein